MSPSAVLAQRFQQKWMASHPDDSCSTGENIDDSLTNLAWLQDLRVVELTLPRLASSESAGTGRDIVKQGNVLNGCFNYQLFLEYAGQIYQHFFCKYNREMREGRQSGINIYTLLITFIMYCYILFIDDTCQC